MTVVEVLDGKLASCERCEEVDALLHNQIIAFPPEHWVRLLLNDNDDVARDSIGRLVGLAVESDGLAVLHALVDVDLEHLALVVDLLAVACLALVLCVDDLSLALAVRARLLHLLNHRTHLAHYEADALAIAPAARPHGAFLPSFPVAFGAHDVLLQGELARLALEQVCERHGQLVHEVLALARPLGPSPPAAATTEEAAAASAAKELREEVLRIHAHPAAHPTRTLETFLAELVIPRAHLRVGQHLERAGHLLELVRGLLLLAWVAVRVVLQCCVRAVCIGSAGVII